MFHPFLCHLELHANPLFAQSQLSALRCQLSSLIFGKFIIILLLLMNLLSLIIILCIRRRKVCKITYMPWMDDLTICWKFKNASFNYLYYLEAVLLLQSRKNLRFQYYCQYLQYSSSTSHEVFRCNFTYFGGIHFLRLDTYTEKKSAHGN